VSLLNMAGYLLDIVLRLRRGSDIVTLDLGRFCPYALCSATEKKWRGTLIVFSTLLAYRRKIWRSFVCARECSEAKCRAIVCKGTTRLIRCYNVSYVRHTEDEIFNLVWCQSQRN
jgi:hypothetical protein